MALAEPTTAPLGAPTKATRTLDTTVLEGFRARAATYDRDNRFFAEDFAQLRDAGYLLAAVPVNRGGWGFSLAQLAEQQRRLARYAPATALAMCMHHYWVGIAAQLEQMGDTSCSWMLDEVAAGEVFAAGHAEDGNDVPVDMSTAVAVPVEGGYLISGRKHFTSLSPVWTRLGAHALDSTDPANPRIVHAIVDRGAPGVRTDEVWDTLGMRATQSHDTVLDEVFVPTHRVNRVVPAGDPSDPYNGLMSMWALNLISNVYVGIAERAFELAVDSARTRTAVTIPGGTYSRHPFTQHQVAEMFFDLHAARSVVDGVAHDWSDGVDHGDAWPMLLMSSKWRAVESARRVVDRAMDVAGGGAMFRRNELERLYRDVRAGGYHPPTDAYAHEVVGKVALGVAGDGGPRW